MYFNTIRINSSSISNRWNFSKWNFWIWNGYTDNHNSRNGWYYESSFLIKGVSETIKKEAKEQKVGFLNMLLSTLGTILLGNLVRGKGFKRRKRFKRI